MNISKKFFTVIIVITWLCVMLILLLSALLQEFSSRDLILCSFLIWSSYFFKAEFIDTDEDDTPPPFNRLSGKICGVSRRFIKALKNIINRFAVIAALTSPTNAA